MWIVEIVVEPEVVEADRVADQRQQRQDLEAELMAGVRGAHARPGRVVEAERRLACRAAWRRARATACAPGTRVASVS